MREIKFRGKRVDNGEWVYGYYYAVGEHHYIHSVRKLFGESYQSSTYQIDPKTVGQFTGLCDKDGKNVYEGDIVVKEGYLWFDNVEPNYRGTVEWIYSQWQVVAHCVNPNKSGISDGMNEGLNDDGFDDDENSDWIIIGNIHDNSDLLGKSHA